MIMDTIVGITIVKKNKNQIPYNIEISKVILRISMCLLH